MQTADQCRLPPLDALHTLIAAIPGVVYQFKVQAEGAWQFLYLSPGIETLYEVSPEAAYADPDALTCCIVPEDRPGHRAAVEHASYTLTAWFHEHQIQTPKGQRKWVRGQAMPHRQPDGSVLWYGILTDITQQKQVETALQDREAQYRRLMEHLHAGVVVHASEERLSLVLRGTNDGFWDWDLVRNTLYYSPRWWAMLGYTEGELPDDPDLWRRLMHPDDVEFANQVFAAALANGTRDYQVESRLRHKDGHEVWVFSRGFIQRDAQGQAIRVSGANMDITERKHYEECLKLSEARYQAIIEGQADLVCRFLPEGTLTFVNSAYCAYFGRSSTELLATPLLDLIPEQDRAFVAAKLAECNAEHPFAINEHQVRRADGEWRWIQWNNQAILDENRALIELQSVGRDVTAQRQAEAALRDSERFTLTILNSLSESIVVLDAQGLIVTVNRAWQRFAEDNGAPELVDRSVGLSYREVCLAAVDPPARESALTAWTGIEAVMTGTRDHFTLEYPCNSPGRSLWFRMSVYPLVTLQGGVVIAHENITERKRLEVALHAMATTDDLTGIANRRHFMACLDEERARLQRQDTQHAAVLMLDLDHFKTINDTFGHAAGDAVLRHCAGLMRDGLRSAPRWR